MLNILVNAYAVSPNWGSEQGVGWNWVINIAKYCNCHIITEGEWRGEIEEAIQQLPQRDNLHFYYNPLPDKVRRMCWNQGDWRFYYYYEKWQKKTLKIAKEIIANNKIDIIHQLNMVGFREPGFLWQINDLPFVWGPMGGMLSIDRSYLNGGGWKLSLFHKIKQKLNYIQLNYGSRIVKALRRADLLISATPDFYNALKRYHNIESIIIPETGCSMPNEMMVDSENRFFSENFNILWVGRMIFTKRLDIALHSIAEVKDLSGLKLHICGDGSPSLVSFYKQLIKDLDIENSIVWHGRTSHHEVQQLMSESQLFLFTSVKEATSTVILEAVTNRLPVLCFDISGMGYVIDEHVGRKVKITTPKQSVIDFSNHIRDLYSSREDLRTMSLNCGKRCDLLSWENKAKTVVAVYNKIVNRLD